MAVYIELTTDAFEEVFARRAEKYEPSDRAGLSSVRRPLRGIEIKEDTYAMLKCIQADGTELRLYDSGSPEGSAKSTANFILQSVQEARMEKHQIIETFGEPYIYFFGEAPRFLDCQAILINTLDFNWEAEWWGNWERRFRGTKSAELGARTYLFYDDTIVEGYMLMAQAVKMSDTPYTVSINWRMFVTNYRNISFVGNPNFPDNASVNLPPNVSLTDGNAFESLIQLFTNSGRAQEEGLAFNDEVNRQADQVQNGFGGRSRLTDTLRRGTRSIAFAPGVLEIIDTLHAQNAQDLPELDLWDRLTSKPIRSKIADNDDEFTGRSPQHVDLVDGFPPEVYMPRVRTIQEAQDLFLEAIRWMSCFGADINNYTSISGLGMGVTFGSMETGIGIGLGAGISAGVGGGATFGAVAQGSAFAGAFGGASAFSTGFGPGNSANGFSANASLSTGASTAAEGDVFFGSAQLSAVAGVGSNETIDTGFGDPTYGYTSPFGGAGFGQAGFGDFGGLGYGSGFGSTGDPGYMPPDEFTFAGVEDERDAFDRFVRPKQPYGAGFGGTSAGASFAGVGAGAAVSVGGSISAFSLVAVPGSLDPTGQSFSLEQSPQQQALNPFGVSCLDQVGISASASVSAGGFIGSLI